MVKDLVRKLFISDMKMPVQSVQRFMIGLCHYVFHVKTADGRDYVFRMADRDNRRILEGSLYWLTYLEGCGIPIPKIISNGIDHDNPYLILSFFEGKDLGVVYNRLSRFEKDQIAKELCDIQERVARLPEHHGYGYLNSYESSDFKSSWYEVIQEHINNSINGIRYNKIFDGAAATQIESLLPKFENYLDQIRPVAFLDDASTKNVLIHNGTLSGIVDLDSVCFGDRIYFMALTRMSLLKSGFDTEYIDCLVTHSNLNTVQRLVLDFYTLIFCVDFMSEIGCTFNKDVPLSVSAVEKLRMESLFNHLFDKLSRIEDVARSSS